jgi:replicative DNA helicase
MSTLGAMLISSSAISEIVAEVKPEDFYRPAHEAIFRAIADLFSGGQAVDAVTVAAELEGRSKARIIGGAPYLLTLQQSCPTAVNGASYARIVAEKATRRRLLAFGVRCQELAHKGDAEDIDTVIAQAEQFLKEVNLPKEKTLSFHDLYREWNDWLESDIADDLIPTPWYKVNEILSGGLYKSRLYVFAGRPGQGKSISALNIAAHAAHHDKSAIVFSLEMPKNEVMSRLLASGAEVSFQQIIRRQVKQETSQRIEEYYSRNAGMRFYCVDKPNLTVEQIAAECRAIKDLDMVVIDYAQLVKATDRRAKRNEQVAHVTRTLKTLAKELHVVVVLAAQMNRQSVDPKTGKARLPVLSDLGESGALEADADAVLFLHRPEEEDGTVDIVIAKNRSGMAGVVPLMFVGHQARLGS